MQKTTNAKINNQFIESCKTGNLIEAIRLLNLGADVHAQNDVAFLWSCQNGHIEIAKWLQGLGADICAENDRAFKIACKHGYFEMVKWLHSLGADIHSQDNFAFVWSCENGHFKIAKWLQCLGADIHAKDDYVFTRICQNGNFKIAKWLQSLGADIHARNNLAITLSISNGHTEITNWLQGLINDKQPVLIKVNIVPGNTLFYKVNDSEYSVTTVETISHSIPECHIRIGPNKYNIVNDFGDKSLEPIGEKYLSINIPTNTLITQNGIQTRLVKETTFNLEKQLNFLLPKGSKLQVGSAQFTLENEVLCECD